MHWTRALLLLRWVLLPDKGLNVVAQRGCNTKLTKVWQMAWPVASLPHFTTISYFSISLNFLIFECKILLFPTIVTTSATWALHIFLQTVLGIVIQNAVARLPNQIVTFVLCFSYSGLSVVGVVWMEQLQRGLRKRNKNQSQVNTAIPSITKWTSLFSPKSPIRLT